MISKKLIFPFGPFVQYLLPRLLQNTHLLNETGADELMQIFQVDTENSSILSLLLELFGGLTCALFCSNSSVVSGWVSVPVLCEWWLDSLAAVSTRRWIFPLAVLRRPFWLIWRFLQMSAHRWLRERAAMPRKRRGLHRLAESRRFFCFSKNIRTCVNPLENFFFYTFEPTERANLIMFN